MVMTNDATVRQESLLTLEAVAERLAIKKDHVYRLIRQGQLRAVRIGALLRIAPSEVERFIEQGGSRSG